MNSGFYCCQVESENMMGIPNEVLIEFRRATNFFRFFRVIFQPFTKNDLNIKPKRRKG